MLEEYKKQYALIIIGAIVLVISLLWRDVINDIKNAIFPKSDSLLIDFAFAFILTAVAVGAIVYVKNSLHISESNNEKVI